MAFNLLTRSVFALALAATLLHSPVASAASDSRLLTIQSLDANGKYQGDIKFTIDSNNNTQIEICPTKEVLPSASGCLLVGTFDKFDLRDLLVKINDTAVLKREIKTGMNLVLVSVAVALGFAYPAFSMPAALLGSVPAITCVQVNGDLQGSERCTKSMIEGIAILETLRPGASVTIKAHASLPEFLHTFKKVLTKLQ